MNRRRLLSLSRRTFPTRGHLSASTRPKKSVHNIASVTTLVYVEEVSRQNFMHATWLRKVVLTETMSRTALCPEWTVEALGFQRDLESHTSPL